MTKHNAVKQVNLGMIPLSETSVNIGQDLFLDDNFSQESIVSPTTQLDEEGMFQLPLQTPYKQMFILMIVCTYGNMRIRLNLQDYDIKERDIVLVYPGVIIDGAKAKPGTKAAVMAFAEDTFFEDDNDDSIKLIRKHMLHPHMINLLPREMDMLIPMYKLMRTICSCPSFDYKKDAAGGCLRIMASGLAHWISHTEDIQTADNRSRNEHLFMNFLEEVQAHCATQRKISYYARKFCISPKYFAKLIYDASGKHASEWIRDYVILEAKAMLRTGNYTVQQVSDALHFPNSSFFGFGKYFKAAVGCSPRRYAIEQ